MTRPKCKMCSSEPCSSEPCSSEPCSSEPCSSEPCSSGAWVAANLALARVARPTRHVSLLAVRLPSRSSAGQPTQQRQTRRCLPPPVPMQHELVCSLLSPPSSWWPLAIALWRVTTLMADVHHNVSVCTRRNWARPKANSVGKSQPLPFSAPERRENLPPPVQRRGIGCRQTNLRLVVMSIFAAAGPLICAAFRCGPYGDFSASISRETASINARCVKAWGKLPRCSPAVVSISSA